MIIRVIPGSVFPEAFIKGRSELRRLLTRNTFRVPIVYTQLELEALADAHDLTVDEVARRLKELWLEYVREHKDQVSARLGEPHD